MPTYEYLCQTCSHRFETWQKMTDEPLTECPECGGHIRRILFPAGVVFKGSGFYVTDHSNSKHASSSTHDDHQTKSSEGSTETKTGGEKQATTESSSNGKAKSTDAASTPSTPVANKA